MGLQTKVGNFLPATTSFPTTGTTYGPQKVSKKTYQMTLTGGSGILHATIVIEASNDLVGWITLATIQLDGVTGQSDGVATDEAWGYARARVTDISGTNASVIGTAASE